MDNKKNIEYIRSGKTVIEEVMALELWCPFCNSEWEKGRERERERQLRQSFPFIQTQTLNDSFNIYENVMIFGVFMETIWMIKW